MPQPTEIAFEGFTLDLKRGALRDGDGDIALRPKCFEVLRHLASEAGRLISKDELANAVWGQSVVSDESLARCISEIRAALRDQAGRIIATAPRRGYRFSAQVETRARPEIAETGSDRPAAPPLSIVVLPFLNLGGGPEFEPFVDGVTDILTTDLSRISGAFVIARNTAFTFKGKAVDAKLIGGELNVRYVLEGSVQRDGERMRVNVQLIDSESGRHLWAERFDKPVAALFDMQDEIVARLAGALNTELVHAEARRAERTSNPDSMDLQFQAVALLLKGWSPDNVARARDLSDRALAIDPGNFFALATSALIDVNADAIFGADPISAFAAAEFKLTKALSLAPNFVWAHVSLAYLYIVTKRVPQGLAKAEYVLTLDGNVAAAHSIIGLGKMLAGRPAETEAHTLEALRLSPRDADAYMWMIVAGSAKYFLGEFEQAIEWSQRAIDANPNYIDSYVNLALSLFRLGRLEEAKSAIESGLAIYPKFSLSATRIKWANMANGPAQLEHVEKGMKILRLLGVPE